GRGTRWNACCASSVPTAPGRSTRRPPTEADVSVSAGRRGRLLSAESVAGWVFADLLLVLFIVGLGSALQYPPPEPEPKVPPIVGMKTEATPVPGRINGEVLGSGAPLLPRQEQEVCRTLSKSLKPVTGERAALVLIFGGASDVQTGQNVARAIGSQLSCA